MRHVIKQNNNKKKLQWKETKGETFSIQYH